MSQIHAELNDNELIICCDRARMTENDRQVIDIRTLQYGKKTGRAREWSRVRPFLRKKNMPGPPERSGHKNYLRREIS